MAYFDYDDIIRAFMKKHPSIYHLIPLTPVLFVVLFLAGPSYYLFTSVIESSNEVHVTAIVPEQSSSTPVVATSSGGVQISIKNSSDGKKKAEESAEEKEEESGDVEEQASPQSGDVEEQASPQSSDSEDPIPEEESEQIDAEDVPTEEQAGGKIVTTPVTTAIYFEGYSFPNAEVTFSLNGGQESTLQADTDGYFEGVYEEVGLGEQVFSFVAEAYDGSHSNMVSYSYEVQDGSAVYMPYILLPPIIYLTDEGGMEGVSIPGSTIQVYGVDDGGENPQVLDTITVNPDGSFNVDFDLSQQVDYDEVYLGCTLENSECGYSQVIEVQTVGEANFLIEEVVADFTQDIKVNYIDFGFMRDAFLKGNASLFYDLNGDGVLNLKDFSLLNYQWTL